RNKGMDVPGDISVMGCDDIPSAKQQLVPLSTIGLSTAKLAQEAWRVLGGVLKGEHSLDNHSDVLIAPELIPRDSTRAI
ncbi:MAG: substrate-binding domain-containing protein, partial [Phycisphaeraceae bacterium]|nr:substrate-binding domain-containing protein [Phycisphaeraceae bacterium]